MGSTEAETIAVTSGGGATSTVDTSVLANFNYRGYPAAPVQYSFDPSPWPSAVSSQVPPLDPGFGLGALGNPPGDQTFLGDPVLAGLPPYAPMPPPPFFLSPGDSNFTWNDPVMASLFPDSYPGFPGLDGNSGSTDALSVGSGTGVALTSSSLVPPLLNGVTGLEGVGDLERTFASLGTGSLGVSVPSSVTAATSQLEASSLEASIRPVVTSASATTTTQSSSGGPPKPQSWAAVASSAPKKRPQPPAVTSASITQHPVGTRSTGAEHPFTQQGQAPQQHQHHQQQQHVQQHGGGMGAWQRPVGNGPTSAGGPSPIPTNRPPRQQRPPRQAQSESVQASSIGLDAIGGPKSLDPAEKLRAVHEYNPKDPRAVNTKNARFFVIKSYSEDDIHRSIKYSIWTSTEHGNKHLDSAYREQKGKPVYLLFSVNGSGHFCGCAQMCSEVDYSTSTGIWSQDKWKGKFDVKWIYVKDVPNNQLRHIRLENNENKPVTNSRDTQEVPLEKARQVMKIMHHYQHQTSIFDDFGHYEKRQEHDSSRRVQRKP